MTKLSGSGKQANKAGNAPPGYLTAKQAMTMLGLNPQTFHFYVRQGKIKREVPPMRTEGFYKKEDISRIATEMALFLHGAGEEEPSGVEVRLARPEDAEGIAGVLSRMGWRTAEPDLRRSWMMVNPFIDHVITIDGEVTGYIHAIPYREEALADMMAGRKRAWDITPADVLPFEDGKEYALYVGIATRQDIHRHHENNQALLLISGFMAFLGTLADRHIVIRQMYAVSDQPRGMNLCRHLGFIQDAPQEGDLFPRWVFDMTTADSKFADIYRGMLAQRGKRIRPHKGEEQPSPLMQSLQNTLTVLGQAKTVTEEEYRLFQQVAAHMKKRAD